MNCTERCDPLGKVYELASLDIEEIKEVLHERGIVRKLYTTPVEVG